MDGPSHIDAYQWTVLVTYYIRSTLSACGNTVYPLLSLYLFNLMSSYRKRMNTHNYSQMIFPVLSDCTYSLIQFLWPNVFMGMGCLSSAIKTSSCLLCKTCPLLCKARTVTTFAYPIVFECVMYTNESYKCL